METPINAYLPPHLANSTESRGYQKIANDLRDIGIDVIWTANGPSTKKIKDASFMFMYPPLFPDGVPERYKKHED